MPTRQRKADRLPEETAESPGSGFWMIRKAHSSVAQARVREWAEDMNGSGKRIWIQDDRKHYGPMGSYGQEVP